MAWLRKKLLLLIVLFIIYASFFISLNENFSKQQILGVRSSLILFTQPENGRQQILDAIDNASKEIDIEMYLFSDKQIIDAIEKAENRGIIVRVLLEKNPFGAGSINQKTFTDLQQHNIMVSWTHDVFPLTHEKMILIDEKEVFILNQNLTNASFEKNREFDIIDTNPQDITAIKDQFTADWNTSPFSFSSTHILLSPINSRAILTNIILQATKTLSIETEVIDDPRIQDLLIGKAKSIHIDILLPSLEKISANKKIAKKLHDEGISVRFLDSLYPHAKLIIADSQRAYIGSINLTSQSMDENRELGIIISEQDIILNVDKIFMQDWDNSVSL